MKKAISYVGAALAFAPAFVLAQTGGSADQTITNVGQVLERMKGLINTTLIVLAGVAVVVFVFGIIRYVLATNDQEKRKEARGYMIYSVIAFAVIMGLYGLATTVLSFFGVNTNSGYKVPQVGGTISY